MGLGPIPWNVINEYAQRYRIDDLDAFDRFVFYIRAMDDAWLSSKVKKT